jgi:hypothetical protein
MVFDIDTKVRVTPFAPENGEDTIPPFDAKVTGNSSAEWDGPDSGWYSVQKADGEEYNALCRTVTRCV